MSGRLNGPGIEVTKMHKGEGLRIHQHATMVEAINYALLGNLDQTPKQVWSEDTIREALTGNAKLPSLEEEAEALITAAMVEDPRLVKRHGWVHAEEGIVADPAMISAGEPNCFLDRRRLKLADGATGEPVRIVISTDSTEDACDSHVVAFIAAAKLAQQFRPLEIWWQGAWLVDDYNGEVLLAPLIQGDMDFSRVQYFLGSKVRDGGLSYHCMWYHACTQPSGGKFFGRGGKRTMYQYGGHRATESHLPNTFDFVRETGLKSDPDYIARLAAQWAGLDSLWSTQVSTNEAEQYWRDTSGDVPYVHKEETTKERIEREARWKADDKAREREQKEMARKRFESN